MFAFYGLFLVCLFCCYFMFSFVSNRKFILILKDNVFMDCFVFFILVYYFTDGLNYFDFLKNIPFIFFFWLSVKFLFFPIDFVKFFINKLKD